MASNWQDVPCILYGTANRHARRWVNGRCVQAHRAAWEEQIGPIPEALVLDHLCRVKNCVNVLHLEPVTSAENTRRGDAGKVRGAQMAAKTHCPQGHEYTPNNLRASKEGWRLCKACHRARAAARRCGV